ncbi:fluoride efflux transporter FluC [Nocardioides donggukensis]|uniref:Fluoride-specific ion channel FluC n=1 Tax=Nocardioides donggukensis TaxID=2774019 RepID=A0A927PZ25_9ACTN|nr:CrcB family protein [Nocardioides donggukensis]MBD8868290.1 CrcB family protein [Nocardioides donggukensis]
MTRPTPTPGLVAAVALGGALGALGRWAVGELTPPSPGFPWATLAVNVAGTLLLALLPAVPLVRRRPALPLFLGTGVLGGFTTLSAYAEESRSMLADGSTGPALAYLVGTLLACVAAVHLGHHFTDRAERAAFAEAEGDE